MDFVAKLNPIVQGLIVSAIAAVICFTNLGGARLWDQDEPRNAGCAKEMLERGDWVVPMFNNELRAQKPALLYWLMMGAYSVFGVSEFSARFWSALLGTVTVLATFFIGRRVFNPAVGLISAIVLASSTMFAVASRAATPDSLLICCGTLALLIYVNGTFSRDSFSLSESCFPKSYLSVLGIYFVLGLGTLAKGPVGFLLPMAIIGMFMLLCRRRPELGDSPEMPLWRRFLSWGGSVFHPVHFAKTVWAMRPLTAIVMVLGIAAPWFVLVGMQTEGDFLNRFFIKENLERATSVMESHSGGLAYYPVVVMLGFFPWSVLTVPVVIAVVKGLRGVGTETELETGREARTKQQLYQYRAVQLLVCWVIVQVGLFSLAMTKLPSYVTPCYPALAILVGYGLHSFVVNREAASVWYRLALVTLVLAGVGMVVAMVFVGDKYLGSDYSLAWLGAIPIVGGSLGLWCLLKSNRVGAVACMIGTSVLLAIGIFGFGTVVVSRHQSVQPVLDQLKNCDQPVATFGVMESSWVFYADRQIHELVTRRSANKRSFQTLDRERFWHRTPWVTPEFFVAQYPGALILTNQDQAEDLLSRLPGYESVDSVDYFLKDGNLVLIGPSDQ